MSKSYMNFGKQRSVRMFATENGNEKLKVDDNYGPDFENPIQYIQLKLKMLRKDMYITPTKEEIAHLYCLTSETAINNAVHSIIDRHWSKNGV